jgi:phosphoglycerate-specific signal transduction histidine kinase
MLSGHSAPRSEIETAATPGPSRECRPKNAGQRMPAKECRFGNSDKLFEPFVTMKLAGLSFGLSIWRSIKRRVIDAGRNVLTLGPS